MDDFPEDSMKDEEGMMDVLDAEELDTTSEDYRDFRANLSTPVSAPDQCKLVWYCSLTIRVNLMLIFNLMFLPVLLRRISCYKQTGEISCLISGVPRLIS